MANGFSQFESPNVENLGFDWEQELDPRSAFRQFAQQRYAPGVTRSAFASLYPSLSQQYLLAAPGGGEFPAGGSFANFLGGYAGNPTTGAGGYGMSQDELQRRAQAASIIGAMSGQEYGDFGAGNWNRADIGSWTPQQAALYRSQYGTAENAAANRAQLANLLAMQRPGGGAYGGIMGQAIASAMGELQANLQAQQPGQDFLQWYMANRPMGNKS